MAQAVTEAHNLVQLGLDHIDHLHDALINHFLPDGPVDDFLEHCDALAQDLDPTTATGATHLASWTRSWSRAEVQMTLAELFRYAETH